MSDNIFQRIGNLFRKESKTGKVLFRANNGANWSKRNDKAFMTEGYQKNVIVFRSVDSIAKAVAAIPVYVVDRNGKTKDNSPLLDLIEKPNPLQTREKFLEAVIGFYKISGNSYIERTMMRNTPLELYALRTDRMTIKGSETGLPSKYTYKVGQQTAVWPVDKNGVSDILHFKTFNPLDDYYGMSPIEAGAFGVDQHNETMTHIQALLQNGASPSGALYVEDGESELSEDQFNRLKAEIEEKYSGSKNAGRPLLLEGGLRWQEMGLSPHDMEIIATKYSAARDIALALGVPPMLLNIPGDNTYSNYKEARLAFYEGEVIPLADQTIKSLNAWLSPFFNGDKLKFDYDQIPAIIEKRYEHWKMLNEADDLTINEKRKARGYDDIDGGDQVYIPSNSIPLSFDIPTGGEGGSQEAGAAGADAYGGTGQDVQSEALNGAQIASLSEIVQLVSTGQMSAESATGILIAAFPTLSADVINQIIEAAADFEPETDSDQVKATIKGIIDANNINRK
jgi:HK97 family phage portal protein